MNAPAVWPVSTVGFRAPALAFLSLISLCGNGWAGAGTTGLQFLRIGPGARQQGMADAGTFLADDALATYYNPAGIASIRHSEMALLYHTYVEGIGYGFLGMVTPLGGAIHSLGWSFAYLGSGKMDRRLEDATGTSYTTSGQFQYEAFAVGLSYARELVPDTLTAGLTVKGVMDQAQDTFFGFAADAGILYKRPKYQFGLAVQHAGPPFGLGRSGSEPLPLTVRAGAGTRVEFPLFTYYHELFLGVDFLWYPESGNIQEALGAEVWLLNFFGVRAGYKAGHPLEALTLGGSVRFAGDRFSWQVDYAFVPSREPLATIHRFGLSFRFGLQ